MIYSKSGTYNGTRAVNKAESGFHRSLLCFYMIRIGGEIII